MAADGNKGVSRGLFFWLFTMAERLDEEDDEDERTVGKGR